MLKVDSWDILAVAQDILTCTWVTCLRRCPLPKHDSWWRIWAQLCLCMSLQRLFLSSEITDVLLHACLSAAHQCLADQPRKRSRRVESTLSDPAFNGFIGKAQNHSEPVWYSQNAHILCSTGTVAIEAQKHCSGVAVAIAELL